LQAKIDELRRGKEAGVSFDSSNRRESVSSKDIDRRGRKIDSKLQELKQENEKLKRKNVHCKP
jgi:hypothetical protein